VLLRWLEQRREDSYLDDLMRTKGQDDGIVSSEIGRVLFSVRMRSRVAPWIVLAKSPWYFLCDAWEYVHGRYRKAGPPVYSSPVIQSSGGAGTIGVAAAGPGFAPIAVPPANPAPAFDDAGVRAGEVTAYRCWRLEPDGMLHSMHMSSFWWVPGQVMEGKPEPPDNDGIHAFKSPVDAYSYAGPTGGLNRVIVTGKVDLWGDVYEHERGYRASKARISAIDDSPYYDAAALRKLYKIPPLTKRKRKPTITS
jgi:hypothetical protein